MSATRPTRGAAKRAASSLAIPTVQPAKRAKASAAAPSPKESQGSTGSSEKRNDGVTASTRRKKAKQLEEWLETPFPNHKGPNASVYDAVEKALYKLHPDTPIVTGPVGYDGHPPPNGELPDVLATLVRVILSQNTNTTNESTLTSSLREKYGENNFIAIHCAPLEEVVDTLKKGGLANVKGKAIKGLLAQVAEEQASREGLKSSAELDNDTKLSLQHVHKMSDKEALETLVSYPRVGPKTAGGLMMFCLGRDMFAVDTHILRISKALGWVPEAADADKATRHLNARIPKQNKKGLHFLLIRHGQACRLCGANGNLVAVSSRFDPHLDIAKEDCPLKNYYKETSK